MFLSEKYKLAFYEVPRTGSNSITAALTEFDPESPTVIKRLETNVMADYHGYRIPDDFKKPFISLASHRNPYERLWSFWKHRNKNGNPPIFKETSWPRYVQWACDPSSVPEIKKAMFDKPISEMFNCDEIDYWLCFESLEKSWREFGENHGFNLPELKVVRASRKMGHVHEAYNKELASMVASRFEADFIRFGYDFDSWKK